MKPPYKVGFDPVTYRVGEGSGTVELRVSVLNGDLTEPITLNYEPLTAVPLPAMIMRSRPAR